ncbi:MAG: hypothetical protein ABW171_17380 [Steroidobacter sp.]
MKYLALFALLSLAGCATTQPITVTSWLDSVSAVTITAQSEALVMERFEKRRTINGRDYAQLTAIEVNRMGDRKLYLVAVLWSNAQLSGKQWDNFESSFAQVEVRLDEQALTLNRHTDIAALGIGQSPMPLPIPGARQIIYPIERAQLQAIAGAQSVELTSMGGPVAPQLYEEHKDGRHSLNDFLSQLPGGSSSTTSSNVGS